MLRGLKDFAPKPWPERFRELQAAGGRIEIAKARVQQGETIATANGALGLSPQRPARRPAAPHRRQSRQAAAGARPRQVRRRSGAAKPLDNAANKLDRIAPGLGGIARQNAGPALVAGLNFIGQPAELEGERAVTLPLRFDDGAVSLGPIPLGQTPPLF